MFGWIRERFWDHIKWSPDRSQIAYLLPFDSRQYLSPLSRKETVRMVEGLAQQFGIIKEGFRGIARHVTGKGLELQLNTAELPWNEEAEMQFEEYFITPGRFDLAGLRNGYEAQSTAVEQRIFRGEFFAAAVDNPRDPWKGEPCWQLFDSNEIATPDGEEEGPVSRIFDGVKLDENNHRIEYYVKSALGEKAVPAPAMVHWFQPTGINQTRGESDFAPVINRIVNWHDLELLFTKHAKTHATIAVAVNKLGKLGGRGGLNAIKGDGPDGTVQTAALEKAFPGMIAYLGAEGKAELLNSNAPSEQLAKFITDVLAPNVFAALGIPPEFFWQVTRAGGATQRFILTRADLLFQILADGLICHWLNAVAFRFISHRIRTGRLAAPKDPNWSAKMSWQTPAKLSIDRGDRQLEIEELRNGKTNLRRCFDQQGLRWREETRQWIREFVVFKQLAKEEGMSDTEAIELMARWRPLPPGVVSPEQQAASASAAPPDEDAFDRIVCELQSTRHRLNSLSR